MENVNLNDMNRKAGLTSDRYLIEKIGGALVPWQDERRLPFREVRY